MLSAKGEQTVAGVIKKALDSGKMKEDAPKLIKFVPVTIVAKIVRAILKDLFPNTKFSVRSERYSMGSSIHICFVGTYEEQMDLWKNLDWLCCKGFDGMTDSTYYTDPVEIGGYRIQPTSWISVKAVDAGDYLAGKYNLD